MIGRPDWEPLQATAGMAAYITRLAAADPRVRAALDQDGALIRDALDHYTIDADDPTQLHAVMAGIAIAHDQVDCFISQAICAGLLAQLAVHAPPDAFTT